MTTTIKIARTVVLAAVASSMLALTAPAFAAPVDDDALPQAQLNVAGTDFTSAKSVDHLKARVRRVAYEICVPNGNGAVLMTNDQSKCFDTAVNDGLTKIASKQELALRSKTVNVASAQIDTHPAH